MGILFRWSTLVPLCSFFTPDNDDVAAKAAEIEHRNHEEEVAMFEELQRANREEDSKK